MTHKKPIRNTLPPSHITGIDISNSLFAIFERKPSVPQH